MVLDAVVSVLGAKQFTAAGRLSFNEMTGQWSITFTENDGIPVTFGTTTLPSFTSPEFDHEVLLSQILGQ
jgi:hypothetical protein